MDKRLIELAERLADAAGEAIRPHFRHVDAEDKADSSPVTEADRAAEQAMRNLIKAERSEDGIVGEEFGDEESRSGYTWVLDPIDGTCAFLAGRPIFGTLIGLLKDGWPVLGIIDQPVLGERWLGVTGRPTTMNGNEVSTRRCPQLSDAVIATTGPHYFTPEQGDCFMALAGATNHKRMVMGGDCYNYAMLSSGHLDIVAEAGLKAHDWAALVPVVEGAGGMMTDWQGDPLGPGSGETVLALGDPARLDDALEALGEAG